MMERAKPEQGREPEDFLRLLLTRETRLHCRVQTALWVGFLTAVPLFLACDLSLDVPVPFAVTALGAGVAMAFGWSLHHAGAASGRFRSLFRTVAAGESLANIAPLVEALRFDWAREEGLNALERLLPRVTPEHLDLLDARQQRILMEQATLCYLRDGRFTLAVLRVMAQVGNAETLASMRRLAASRVYYVTDRERQEAIRRVKELEARLALRRETPTTLLRAAPAPVDAPHILLRATTSAANAAPEQLLRPTVGRQER